MSAYTLETKQGNAIDTASLLIALLRAAKIPARYAYGTVEIPAAQVMNWVGGASTPEAAYQLLSQGGIPTVGLVEGGVIKAFRLFNGWIGEGYVVLDKEIGAGAHIIAGGGNGGVIIGKGC